MKLECFGLQLDHRRNDQVDVECGSSAAFINAATSSVKALVIKANEELMIAKQCVAVLEQKSEQNLKPKRGASTIPVSVSARHAHLNAETFARLFGEDAQPTHREDLYQPGQYACEETVNLIGPRNKITGVRILAPFRDHNQVEISRSDEFYLGFDAPLRKSGNVNNSAPITLEGSRGTVTLDQGLICAHRHIHMSEADADHFNVEDQDEVEVAISGGECDLIFFDVYVRVSPNYRLEMHIDTDEANAAEVGGSAEWHLVYTPLKDINATIAVPLTETKKA